MKLVLKKYSLIAFLTASLLFITLGCSSSSDPEIFAAIHGHVVDETTDQPLEKAKITLSPSGLSITTDTKGYYEFTKLDATHYTLTVQCPGYMPKRIQVTTVLGKNFEVNVQLPPVPED